MPRPARRPGPRRLVETRPASAAADLRRLTPLVLMQALERAGDGGVRAGRPREARDPDAEDRGAVLPALARLGAAVETPSLHGELSTIEAVLPAARVNEVQRHLAGLTGGDGAVESSFAGHEPVTGVGPHGAGLARPPEWVHYER